MTTAIPEGEQTDEIISLLKKNCLFTANFEGINP
jgi:hypothetical protein